ncbi:NADPH-dependent FMN reductase [Haloarcula litorea]|uniref:NADPH-dependent FMN reductase n=1 Tax=Haloarcula litorea TaxID=3032579 RepID=UPI0023E7B228|nr:NADPH-dependent FMN reductase [Halomicroarcula sp. GDY20]
MTDRTHVVGLCGSLRDDSGTRIAVDRALAAAAAAGATTELLDLREWDLPLFDADAADAGDGPELAARIAAADGVVLGTPMYHGTYASPVKTALDYCDIEDWAGTTVGLLAVAGGGFPTPALEHLRAACRELKAWPLPTQVAIPESWAAFEDGTVADAEIAERLDDLGGDVAAYAGVEDYPERAAAGGLAAD